MRVIKFRAKCLDNGEWICGGSSLISDDFCVIQKGTEFYCETRVYSRTERFFQLQGFVCDKNTLGQFTGLLDKNGKEIYEGDIIGCHNPNIKHLIFYNEKQGRFMAALNGDIENVLCVCGLDDSRWTGSKKVIGNVYDNPELLK